MQRRKNFSNIKSSKLGCTIVSSFVGIAVIALMLLLFSLLMTKIDVPEGVVSLMSAVALCVGAYAGGYYASRSRRENGLFLGILCGTLIYFTVFIMGIIFSKVNLSAAVFTKLIIVAICGAIGGVIGVNSKKKRY